MLHISFHPFPVIETERLLLRNLRPSDKQELFEIRSDEETMRYIPRPLAKTMEDVEALIDMVMGFTERNERINWVITEKCSDKLMGMIGYVRLVPESFRAEVGYVLHKDHLRKGFTYEALKAVIDYGFREMKLHSIEAIINPANAPSSKLVEKAGFVKEAYFKDYVFHDGRFWDEEVYSLLSPY
jgi:ribosomal-protein-alanine N-acetyltransferase